MFNLEKSNRVEKTFVRTSNGAPREQKFELKYRKSTTEKAGTKTFFRLSNKLFTELQLDKEEWGLVQHTITDNGEEDGTAVQVAVQIVPKEEATFMKKSSRGDKNPKFTNVILEKALVEAGVLSDEKGNQYIKLVPQDGAEGLYELVRDESVEENADEDEDVQEEVAMESDDDDL